MFLARHGSASLDERHRRLSFRNLAVGHTQSRALVGCFRLDTERGRRASVPPVAPRASSRCPAHAREEAPSCAARGRMRRATRGRAAQRALRSAARRSTARSARRRRSTLGRSNEARRSTSLLLGDQREMASSNRSRGASVDAFSGGQLSSPSLIGVDFSGSLQGHQS